MIAIYVGGRQIDLPEDVSFEYVSENRLFSNADGYSFDIEIPLKDSAVNTDIFGMIWRKDADFSKIRFDATLVTENVALHGALAIVARSESHLSVQFLQGRSVQNFEESFEEKYINELELGVFSEGSLNDNPVSVWGSYDDGVEAVAIPWVNNNSDSGNIQNNAVYMKAKGWEWHEDTRGLSFMPFLIVIIRKVCQAMGYAADLEALENSQYRHLLLCNTLPYAWRISNYALCLPHWTINEFFENLEPILRGEFDIDHLSKKIVFSFTADILDSPEPVVLDKVIDDFDTDIKDDSDNKSDLELMKNLGFSDNGSRFWPLCSCDWFVEERKKNPDSSTGWLPPGTQIVIGEDGRRHPDHDYIYKSLVEFDTMAELVNFTKPYEYFAGGRNNVVQNNLYYAKDVDCYFIYHSVDYLHLEEGWFHHYELLPVNGFGKYIMNPEDDDAKELKTVPVPIDRAEYKCVFLSFSSGDDSDSDLDADSETGLQDFDKDGNIVHTADGLDLIKAQQPWVYRNIEKGEKKTSEYFDKLYLGFWPGYVPVWHLSIGPRPITSNIEVYDFFKYFTFPEFNLRLNVGYANGAERYRSINSRECCKFSFLSDTLPDVRATFYIAGKRYVCAKLNATFSASGMSRLIKGEFYRF